MEKQVFSTWYIVSKPSCRACRPLKKPSTVSLAQQAGQEAGRAPQALLTWGKPALSGIQGFLQPPTQSVHKPTVLGRVKLQRPAIKPTHIKEKVNL